MAGVFLCSFKQKALIKGLQSSPPIIPKNLKTQSPITTNSPRGLKVFIPLPKIKYLLKNVLWHKKKYQVWEKEIVNQLEENVLLVHPE